MTDELIKQLLEAGVHFGHQTKRWNPKMKKFIFGARSNIYIIDLEKTAECLNRARDFVHDIASRGGKVLFVGTKKQAQDVIESEARRSNMFYVRHRWLGGLLTNFKTIAKSIDRLNEIEKMETDGIFQRLTKKEVARLGKEKTKLLRDLAGIRAMGGLPQVAIIVDAKKEEIAVREANRLHIPIIGIIDTNSDPDVISYPIPANDDALKSIRFILTLLTDSIVAGREKYLTAVGIREKAAAEQKAREEEDVSLVDEKEIQTYEDSEERQEEEKRGPTKVRLSRERK